MRDVPAALESDLPLVVVDLDGAASVEELDGAARVVRGSQLPVVGRLLGSLPDRADALLGAVTTAVGPLPGDERVVGVEDVDVALARVEERVSACPTAASTLVGLLRLTTALPVAEGLVAESLAYSTLLAGPEFARWRASRPVKPVPADDTPAVRLERVDDDLHVALSRPRRHNAFSREVRDALLEGLAVAQADPALRVHLRGEGPSFCSGGDLDEFGTATDVSAAHLVRLRQSAGRVVHELADRTTAHLHGACIGAGIEVPAFAGRVVADADTRFQLPELGMGLVPGAGGTVSVLRRIGRPRTAWWVLSGATLDATSALAWGLVDEIA